MPGLSIDMMERKEVKDSDHVTLKAGDYEDSSKDARKLLNASEQESYSGNSQIHQDTSVAQERRGMTKELMMLAFKNPGPLTSAAFDFSPEQLTNREKRKLNRLMERGTRSKEAAKSKAKKQQALHDSSGCLVSDGRDLCDCQDPECPGCHYACQQCGSEKCGTVCRCERKWTYDQIDVYNKERTFSR